MSSRDYKYGKKQTQIKKILGGKNKMFENDKNNGFFGNDGGLDLGSASGDFGGFAPFDSTEADAIFGGTTTPAAPATTPENTAEENNAAPIQQGAPIGNESQGVAPAEDPNAVKVEETNNEEVTNANAVQPETVAGTNSSEQAEVPNLFEAAVAKAEEKQAETTKNSLTDKLPIFVHGSAKEEIVDTSKTFEQLRLEKAEDFPELDEGDNVSWKVTYGTITKVVTNKKDTIASFKKKIEDSKEFVNALKKAKGTEIECKVSPTITAKKKGIMSSYKGLYASVDEAMESGKVISFVPLEDGRVFEVRNSKMGTFIAPTEKVTSFKKVRAGFIPALPKIPYNTLSEIIAFFKSYVDKDGAVEALAYIYWSFADSRYYVYVPKQIVGKARVDSSLPEMDEDKFMLVMEIHSHNTMPGFFSPTDDSDEKATRLYTVVGRMDKVFPEIKTRISCGGKFVEIAPEEVFEGYSGTFPEKWRESVEIGKRPHKEADL